MNRKSKFITFSLAAVMGVCTVSFAVKSVNVVKETKADGLYTLTINEIASSFYGFGTGIYPATTDYGNEIRIGCNGAKKQSRDGQTYNVLMQGKNFENYDSLGSINQIIFNDVLEEVTINVEYGWLKDGGTTVEFPYYDVFTVTSGERCVIDISGYKPNYFCVVANSELNFKSCEVTYECTESEKQYAVKCASTNTTMGTVTGSGLYKYDDTVTLTATPAPYTDDATITAPYRAYKFDGWYEGSTCLSTNSVYTFKMPKQNKTIYARFGYEPLKTNDIIYHGHYPQTRVTDTTIINKLNAAASYYPEPANSRKWTILSWYSNKSTSTEYAWYQDVDYQNVKYRGIYFTKYRPKTVNATASDTDTSSYQYKNGYTTGNVYWFKYEPIAWRILENNNSDYFVMSNQILDVVQYSNDVTSKVRTDYNNVSSGSNVAASVYIYSDLRTYLNRNFLSKAFTTDEKARILTTTVDNSSTSGPSSSSAYFTSSCNDKIFSPSYNELGTKYGFMSPSSKDPSRGLFATEYAKCVGINVGTNGKSPYWTRTPYNTYSLAYVISSSGTIEGSSYSSDVLSQAYGIVPAMHLVA